MAGTVERTLALKLIADVGALDKSLRKSEGRIKRFGKSAASWGKAFTGSLAIAGLEKTVELIGDAWEGFRSGQKVAAQLGVTWKNLGLAGAGLASTLDKVTSSATKLGVSDDEAVMAFNKALVVTKDQDAAMRRLKIAYDLVANGAAPDLSSAMDIIRQVAKGSERVLNKFGITADTAGGRLTQLGNKFRGAAKKAADLNPLGVLFNGLNEDLEGIVGSFVTGDIDGAMDAIAGAGDRLATAWTDLGSIVPPGLRAFIDEAAPAFISINQAMIEVMGSVGVAFDKLSPVIQPVLDLLGSVFATVNDVGLKTLKTFASVLRGDFGGAWKQVERVVNNAVRGMLAAWNRLDISVPPFELSWGGGTLFPGTPLAIDIPGGSFKFWSGTGDLFPDIGRSWDTSGGGRGPSGGLDRKARARSSIPGPSTNLPGHKDGLDYVPYDGYVAALHKGERVMTAAENRGGSTSNNYSISVHVAPGGDLVEAGRQTVRAIQEYEKRGGKSWRN
jgi:hypothetical protein